MRITGPEAQFEYDSKKDEISGLNVAGGVKVSDTDKWATSDNLKIDFDADKLPAGQARALPGARTSGEGGGAGAGICEVLRSSVSMTIANRLS